MHRTYPLFSRLAFQLGAAALVSAVAIVALNNLARPVTAPPATAPVQAVNAEIVFTAKPRPAPITEALDEEAAPKSGAAVPRVKAKPASPAPQPRKLAAAEPPSAPQPAPLVIAPPTPAEPAPAAAPERADGGVMGTLRGMTATVTAMPQRAYTRVTNWFTADAEPPRPSVDVPTRDFAKAM